MEAIRAVDVKAEWFGGKFIVFDGIDGSGKDAVRQRIQKRIARLEVPTLLLSDPGGTSICNQLRAILLHAQHEESLDHNAELLLFNASRVQLLTTRIRPALQDGICVLCSRWVFSTYAYQCEGRGHSRDIVKGLHEYACGGFMPHVALFFDVPVEIGKERREAIGDLDRIERYFKKTSGDPDFYARVRQSFLNQARPSQYFHVGDPVICVIDGTGPIDMVEKETWQVLVREFSSRQNAA